MPLKRSGTSLIEECRLLLAIFKLLKSLNPDVIHNVTMKPVLYAGLVNRLIGKKACVNAITGLGFLFTREGLKATIIKKIVLYFYYLSLKGKYNHTIFQNSDDLTLFVSKKIITVEQTCIMKGAGVPLEKYCVSTALKNEKLVTILFPARLLRDKGIIEFVEAAKALGPKYHVKFILAGGIDTVNPSAIMQSELNEWHSLTYIDCIGYQRDMIPLYHRSDIVCLPSYREGMPRALLEAQACGCPVVTTNVPGCRESIIDGKSGLLVKKGSSEELVKALEKLILDKSLREKMGCAARQFAEESFSIKDIVNKTIELYDELLMRKKNRSNKLFMKGHAG